jgi:hypothetical protein
VFARPLGGPRSRRRRNQRAILDTRESADAEEAMLLAFLDGDAVLYVPVRRMMAKFENSARILAGCRAQILCAYPAAVGGQQYPQDALSLVSSRVFRLVRLRGLLRIASGGSLAFVHVALRGVFLVAALSPSAGHPNCVTRAGRPSQSTCPVIRREVPCETLRLVSAPDAVGLRQSSETHETPGRTP